jgi:hypothetical protein
MKWSDPIGRREEWGWWKVYHGLEVGRSCNRVTADKVEGLRSNIWWLSSLLKPV